MTQSPCRNGEPHPPTPDCNNWQCPECVKRLCSPKRMETHRKSHAKRPCPNCNKLIGTNGLAQHGETCDPTKMLIILPDAAMNDRITDFLIHSTRIPKDTLLILTRTGQPAFYTQPAGLRHILHTEEPVYVIPSDLVPKLTEQAKRWRRKQQNEPPVMTIQQDDTPPPPTTADKWANL